MRKGSWFYVTLEMDCPDCKAKAGHWCREKGKAVPSHRSRNLAALDATMAPLGQRKSNGRQSSEPRRDKAS